MLLLQNHKIDLRAAFPVSKAFILRRNFKSLSLLAIVCFTFLGFYVFFEQPGGSDFANVRQFLWSKKILVLFTLSLAILLRLAYDFFYWKRYAYYVERGRLHIESGVVIRQEASVPLNPLCEFYLEKSWIDLFLGTKDLVMRASLGEGQEVCKIQTLKEADAKALKSFLIKQAEQGSVGSLPQNEVPASLRMAKAY